MGGNVLQVTNVGLKTLGARCADLATEMASTEPPTTPAPPQQTPPSWQKTIPATSTARQRAATAAGTARRRLTATSTKLANTAVSFDEQDQGAAARTTHATVFA